jgi:uncharacterized membrane protein
MQSDAPIFEAVISPHRSLSPRALWLVLLVIGVMCCVNAAVFVRIGAWPVGGFCGAELLLAIVLLRLNASDARATELVILSEQGLRIIRTDAGGRRQEKSMSAAWINVLLQERPGRVPALLLVAREVREEIGRSLGEDAKRDLASALDTALYRWRNPRFDNAQLQGEAGRAIPDFPGSAT